MSDTGNHDLTPPVPTPPVPTPVNPNRKRNLIIAGAAGLGVLLLVCCIGVIAVAANRVGKPQAQTTSTTTAPKPKPADIPVDADPTIPPPDTSTYDLPLGESIEGSDTEGKWTITLANPQLFTKPCNPYADNPEGKYLTVEVTFEVTEGVASVNPYDFKYFDASGRTYDGFGMCDDPGLESGDDLRAGVKRTGMVEFNVPNGVEGEIEYSPGFRTIASWKVPAV